MFVNLNQRMGWLTAAGESTHTVTREQFMKMGLREMQTFKQEHPDLYNEYMNRTT